MGGPVLHPTPDLNSFVNTYSHIAVDDDDESFWERQQGEQDDLTFPVATELLKIGLQFVQISRKTALSLWKE